MIWRIGMEVSPLCSRSIVAVQCDLTDHFLDHLLIMFSAFGFLLFEVFKLGLSGVVSIRDRKASVWIDDR